MFGLFYIHNLTFFIHQNPKKRSPPEYEIKMYDGIIQKSDKLKNRIGNRNMKC